MSLTGMSTLLPQPAPTSTPIQQEATPSAITSATASGHDNDRKIPVNQWTADDVADWMKGKGFDEDICNTFITRQISGLALPALNIDNLKSEVGIEAFGTQFEMMNALRELGVKPGIVARFPANPSYDEPYSELPASHPFVDLWSRSWKSKTYKPFVKRPVERDNSGTPSRTDVPSTCWILDTNDWMSEFDCLSSISGILSRDEYREALHAVVDHFKTGNFDFPTMIEGDNGSDSENDDSDEPSDEPPANPFLDLSEDFVSTSAGFILMGQPGIGKTAWLFVVLVLRLMAGLPTILQAHKNRLYYFDDTGVHKLRYSSDTDALRYTNHFSPSTWCLVDTNLDVPTVPSFVLDLALFIVQASSPQLKCIEWKEWEKGVPVLRYFMKPWTLPELITARTLQKIRHTEADLETFHNRFGPSARAAYCYASDLPLYESIIDMHLKTVTRHTISNLVNQATACNFTGAADYVFVITPASLRDNFNLEIPTRYLYEKLRDSLDNNASNGAASMFSVFR